MAKIDTVLSGPGAYALGQQVLSLMQRHQIRPTATNYELWLHYAADPKGRIGVAIERLLTDGQPITEQVADALASNYLPRVRINEQIRDTGDQLARELDSVSSAIDNARQFTDTYGELLTTTGRTLDAETDMLKLQDAVGELSSATRKARRQTAILSEHLRDSTLEVARLKEHLELVRRDSLTDSLTSLANRKGFDEQLILACAEAERSGGILTVALLDIDHFKSFNDTWGHQTGDQVLRYVASIIGRIAAPPRLAARYGGEEFALLCPAEGGDRMAVALETIREEVAGRRLKRRSTNEELGAVTLSAGYAQRQPGEAVVALMERADQALYVSKRTGRNRVTAAADTMAAIAA